MTSDQTQDQTSPSPSQKIATAKSVKPPIVGLLSLCRPGFERECAAELERWLGQEGGDGYANFEKISGQVVWIGTSPKWPMTRD
ncbi:MAG TPA: hypothetical protein VIH30_04460, partial [Aquirhabdus sp.]